MAVPGASPHYLFVFPWYHSHLTVVANTVDWHIPGCVCQSLISWRCVSSYTDKDKDQWWHGLLNSAVHCQKFLFAWEGQEDFKAESFRRARAVGSGASSWETRGHEFLGNTEQGGWHFRLLIKKSWKYMESKERLGQRVRNLERNVSKMIM